MSWPWNALGLDGPADADAVKHAYAQRLKEVHPEEDPEGFQQLHAAYQAARRQVRAGVPPPQEVPVDGESPENKAPEAGEAESTQPEFDYERLFSEGDEERRAAQRRRAEERLYRARERREQLEQAKWDQALSSEEAWNAAFTALRALEVLCAAGASGQDWSLFLHSSVFLDAQHNLDFIFGLEDFLREYAWLPAEIKRRIFLAYHFYRSKPPAVYQGLYRQLLGSYRSAGRANRDIERGLWVQRKPYVLLAAVMSVLIALTLIFNSGHSSSTPRSGSADSVNTASLDSPGSHDRSGEIENDVPLDGGSGEHKTSFYGLVISYAAEDYPGLYAVTGRGTAENEGETFQWMQCTGKDANFEELVMNYYLSEDKSSLYCIPDSKTGGEVELECTHSWRGISVYRCVEE